MGSAVILSDREQFWKCWALSLLSGGAAGAGAGIAAAVTGQPDSESPAVSAKVAQTARRRWACKGVSHVWAFAH